MMMDMFLDTAFRGFQIILNITKVNKYFVINFSILFAWIVLPKKYMKLSVQRIKITSQYEPLLAPFI